jgi:hypothetical protein
MKAGCKAEKLNFSKKFNFWVEVTSISSIYFGLFPLLPYSRTPLFPTPYSPLPRYV